ncbi:MAG: hypothetical protein ACI4AA_11235 [Lachnospiraceae bacterium]
MTENGEKILIRITAVFLILAVAAMGYIRSLQRAEAGSAEENWTLGIREECFEAISGKEADIIIPLPETGSEQFRVEENLKDRMLTVVLENVEEDYYQQYKIRGNEEKISQVLCRQNGGETELQFILNDIYEADIQVKENELHLKLESPSEQWDKIVVLEGDNWNEEAVDRLEENGIKGLMSGDIKTANELRADFYLSLSIEYSYADEQRRQDGSAAEIVIYYNDDYFIPDFDSRAYAEMLQRYLAEEYGAENIRLVKSTEWDLADAMIPAVKIICQWENGTAAGEESETGLQKKDLSVSVAEAIILRYEEMDEQE